MSACFRRDIEKYIFIEEWSMKLLISLVLMLTSLNSFALCGNDKIVLSVNISEGTSGEAYGVGEALFEGSDRVEIFEIATKKSIYLFEGSLVDDQAGNFTVYAENKDGQDIDLYHDHEVWHEDGLQGYYTMTTGEVVDLSDIICDYDDLFTIE